MLSCARAPAVFFGTAAAQGAECIRRGLIVRAHHSVKAPQMGLFGWSRLCEISGCHFQRTSGMTDANKGGSSQGMVMILRFWVSTLFVAVMVGCASQGFGQLTLDTAGSIDGGYIGQRGTAQGFLQVYSETVPVNDGGTVDNVHTLTRSTRRRESTSRGS
jgi:hypothetical protein